MIEKWVTIRGYENYQVSTLGNVKRGTKFIKPFVKVNYMYVGLCKNGIQKHFRLHRLVAEAFIPNPNNLPCINHKDEDKSNNRVDNLEWCTDSYNANYGERNFKISESNSKAVIGINIVSGEKVYFRSATEANKMIPKANLAHISDCCRGNRKSAGGYKWYHK